MFRKPSAPATGPPPLPAPGMEEAPSPIRRAVFNESVRRYLADVSFDYSLIEKSHAQAEEWINSNPSAQIVQIQTFHTGMHGITVVWYR